MAETKVEIPAKFLIATPFVASSVNDETATGLRRAATLLLVLSIISLHHGVATIAGLVASLIVLLASSDALLQKASTVKIFAIVAAAISLFGAVSMAGAAAAGVPMRYAEAVEAQCITLPPAIFAWIDEKVYAWSETRRHSQEAQVFQASPAHSEVFLASPPHFDDHSEVGSDHSFFGGMAEGYYAQEDDEHEGGACHCRV